jgi:hypothetical protein
VESVVEENWLVVVRGDKGLHKALGLTLVGDL